MSEKEFSFQQVGHYIKKFVTLTEKKYKAESVFAGRRTGSPVSHARERRS